MAIISIKSEVPLCAVPPGQMPWNIPLGLSPALVTFLRTPLLHVFVSHSETDQGLDSKAEFPVLLRGFWWGLQAGSQSPGMCLTEGGAGTRHCCRAGMWILVACSRLEGGGSSPALPEPPALFCLPNSRPWEAGSFHQPGSANGALGSRKRKARSQLQRKVFDYRGGFLEALPR